MSDTEKTELRLPFPPSVNAMFLNSPNLRGRGRIPSPDYKAWKAMCARAIKDQHVPPFVGRAVVKIDLDDRRQGDGDNRVKPVLDALVDNGILAGDSKKYVAGHECYWRSVEGCRVVIERAA